MSKARRVLNVIIGLLTLFICLVMTIEPQAGYLIAMMLLCLSLILAGLRYIFYYIGMARHMVGGKSILFIGIGIFDLGLFTVALSDFPIAYIVLYLIVIYAFSGIIGIMRALEARRYGSSRWKIRFSTGVVNLLVAILAIICGLVYRSADMVTYIYCAGLFYSAIMRIVTAFRRSAIVYIP